MHSCAALLKPLFVTRWESFNVSCHQRLVAEWLEQKLRIVVPELGHERAESIPFSEQPSKWEREPKLPVQMRMAFWRAVV